MQLIQLSMQARLAVLEISGEFKVGNPKACCEREVSVCLMLGGGEKSKIEILFRE